MQNANSYKEQLIQFIQEENHSSDEMINFTKYLDFDFSKYLSFILCVSGEQIVAFSSSRQLQHWPQNIARIHNRLYISKKYRSKNMSGQGQIAEISRYALGTFMYDTMVQKCNHFGIKTMVITRQNKGIKNSIFAINKKINILDQEKQWKVYPNYILTCNYPDRQECWQRAIFRTFNKENESLIQKIPSLSPSKYEKLFLKSSDS